MQSKKEEYSKMFKEFVKEGTITKSDQIFKINLFMQKALNSLSIAKYHKDIKPTKDMPKKLYWDYWAICISYYSMLYAAKAAILSKGFEVKTHDAAQTALGYLLVPDEMEREDLELLDKSYKIFEDEYVKYFEDAKIESRTARYSAIKTYTQRRLDEIFNNANEFIRKIKFILE